MTILTNPFVWLRRFRHRCGYGVHSPFAFQFITGVVYEQGEFYDYALLDRELRWWQRFRVRKYLHLLFRLANYRSPRVIVAPGAGRLERMYLQAGAKKAVIKDGFSDGIADLYLLNGPDDLLLRDLNYQCVVVLKGINRYRRWWKTLVADARITVAFDLYDVGIAFCRPEYVPQLHVVNW